MGYFVIFVVEWKQCFSNFHFIAAWSHLLNKYLGPRHLKGTNRKNARETEVVGEATAEVEIIRKEEIPLPKAISNPRLPLPIKEGLLLTTVSTTMTTTFRFRS